MPHGAWFGRAAFIAPALVPRVRGAAFGARAPDVGEDAWGLPGKTGGAELLRRSEARCNARGGSGAGRRRVRREPGTRGSCEIKVFSCRQCWRRVGKRNRTTVDLSVTGAECAWLAFVRVTVRIRRGTAANARCGSGGCRGRGGRSTTVVAGVRLFLVPSFCLCVVAAGLSVLLDLAVMLPTRMARTTPVVLVVVLVRTSVIFEAVSGHVFLSMTESRVVVAERSEVGV